ncbi:hypothetical protein IU474_18345 [Nocardia otitidiscaviarum]|nr:hypothetical protein [Nocardia otitidiscaviarum]
MLRREAVSLRAGAVACASRLPVGGAQPGIQVVQVDLDGAAPVQVDVGVRVGVEEGEHLAWNRAYALLRHDPPALPPERRNLLWMIFTDTENRTRMPRWEAAARAVLGQLRDAVGRRPDDPRLTALVAGLREASSEFRQWWAEYPVRRFRPATIVVCHPEVGEVEVELFQSRPVENPASLLVVQVPTTATAAARLAALSARAETG